MGRSKELYEATLNGILHLFAILSSARCGSHEDARRLVERYLRVNLGISSPEVYVGLFGALIDFCPDVEDDAGRKERVSGLCTHLDRRLTMEQKHVLLFRVLELWKGLGDDDVRMEPVVRLTARSLSLREDELEDMRSLVFAAGSPELLSEGFVLLSPHPPDGPLRCGILGRDHFRAECTVLKMASTGRLFISVWRGDVTLDGNLLIPDMVYPLEAGTILRDANSNAVYLCEIESALRAEPEKSPAVVFEARDVNFRFPGTNSGLHDFSFRERSGRLIGVMGGSGVGKSTLINILNGSLRPDTGRITINGLNLYESREQLQGVIGYVPQDDLLFEDLTVYQNLYLNARLCLANLDERQTRERVERMLQELQQAETGGLKAGGPLDNTISGGQRKRLNIALELIREPTILFVDEPTSGLSSVDSENVMGLLKAQAQRDRLVIVIIHQPSSAIFRMFDSLWIMDKGGLPIYMGHPLEAARYFRKAVHLAGADRNVCSECGNVSPEQVFNTVEARTIDEAGRFTRERKHPPQFWHKLYSSRVAAGEVESATAAQTSGTPPRSGLARPSLPGQIGIFFRRNLQARMANRSYVLVNLLEPALLGWITATICSGSVGGELAFGDNPYLGIFFFMSVVLALFLGLSVSAEEIVRDRRVLKRESFLHLSWFGYSTAKILYLICICAVQMMLCTLACVWVLRIPDMVWKLWAVLFSCAVFGCALGLNISASFKRAITVYILIPLLLIPQMLLGGMIIKFDSLAPRDAGHNFVPLVGDVMVTRWGFEALVVEQYRTNRYQKLFFDVEQEISRLGFLAQALIPEILSRLDFLYLKTEVPDKAHKDALYRRLIGKEVAELERASGVSGGLSVEAVRLGPPDRELMDQFKAWLRDLARRYDEERTQANGARRAITQTLLEQHGEKGVEQLLKMHQNESIVYLVRNKAALEKVRMSGDRLVQVSDPVYQPVRSAWGRAPLMAGFKRMGHFVLGTYWFNLFVIWTMTGLLCLALYARLVPRLLENGWWRRARRLRSPSRPPLSR